MSYVQVILDYVHPAHAAAQHIVLPKNIYQNKFVFGLTLLFISNSQKVEQNFATTMATQIGEDKSLINH